jgi:hypothetical protein
MTRLWSDDDADWQIPVTPFWIGGIVITAAAWVLVGAYVVGRSPHMPVLWMVVVRPLLAATVVAVFVPAASLALRATRNILTWWPQAFAVMMITLAALAGEIAVAVANKP